ncbi:MAG TPA: hypothetical protein VNZ57_05765 [Longimicrobiales bacterium]|nr:hypothetical protein [Longimicrobiales bacterium]
MRSSTQAVTSSISAQCASALFLRRADESEAAVRDLSGRSAVTATFSATVFAAVEEVRDHAGERAPTPIVAAGPAPGGVVVWFIPSPGPLAAIVDNSGRWTMLSAGSAAGEIPEIPLDVLVWENELFILTPEGILVYALS